MRKNLFLAVFTVIVLAIGLYLGPLQRSSEKSSAQVLQSIRAMQRRDSSSVSPSPSLSTVSSRHLGLADEDEYTFLTNYLSTTGFLPEGTATEVEVVNAVRAYQEAYELPATGTVDNITSHAIAQEFLQRHNNNGYSSEDVRQATIDNLEAIFNKTYVSPEVETSITSNRSLSVVRGDIVKRKGVVSQLGSTLRGLFGNSGGGGESRSDTSSGSGTNYRSGNYNNPDYLINSGVSMDYLDNIEVGNPIDFTNGVRNVGNVDGAVATNTTLTLTEPTQNYYVVLSYSTDPIPVGDSKGTHWDNWLPPHAGIYTAETCADADQDITERYEHNNCVSSTFTVAPSSDCTLLSPPSITVLSPNGGETYYEGGTLDLEWTDCNIPDAASVITVITTPSGSSYTYHPGSTNDGIDTFQLNGGPPSTLTEIPGDYKATIFVNGPAGASYVGANDESDNLFTISASTPPPQPQGTPEYMVRSIGYTTQGQPEVNKSVDIFGAVRNVSRDGDASISSTTTLTITGRNYNITRPPRTTSALAKDTAERANWNGADAWIPPAPGTYTLKICADAVPQPNGVISELYEFNNCRETDINIWDYVSTGPTDQQDVTYNSQYRISTSFRGRLTNNGNGQPNINGIFNNQGGEGWFRYSTSPTLASFTETPHSVIQSVQGWFRITVLDLQPNTTYYYKACVGSVSGNFMQCDTDDNIVSITTPSSLACSSGDPQSIALILPNGYGVYNPEDSLSVRWKTCNISGPNVVVQPTLVVAGDRYLINQASPISDTGNFLWNIPFIAPDLDQYKVALTVFDGNNLVAYDESDQYFTVNNTNSTVNLLPVKLSLNGSANLPTTTVTSNSICVIGMDGVGTTNSWIDTWFEYDTSLPPSFGNSTASSRATATSERTECIGGLNSNTLYYVRMAGTDSNGNSITSSGYSQIQTN